MKFDLGIFDAIIFDLGGVILNIDYHQTVEAFQELGLENFDQIYSQAAQTGLFDQFEKGEISGDFFINQLLPYLPEMTSPNLVVHAWNKMLLDFPSDNLTFLKELKSVLPIFLLSNTNEIHLRQVHQKLRQVVKEKHLSSFFQQAYFSHEIGLRKPDVAVFENICSQHNLNPENTLFIDDSIQHLVGAEAAGLKVFHFNTPGTLREIFTF